MLNMDEETMDAYKQKAKAHLKEMKAKMQIIEANAEKANADMRIKYQKYLTDWRSRFSDIETSLDKLSDSTGDAWKDVRSGINSAMDELNNAIDGVLRIKYQKYLTDWRSRFSDIETNLDKLSDSTGDAWKDIRSGINSAMDQLNNAIDGVKKQFNN